MKTADRPTRRPAFDSRGITVSRVFDAPRRMVFEALTRPEHLKHWLIGPEGWTLVRSDIDLRVGGDYCHVWQRSIDGVCMTVRGTYLEIVPGERIVCTETSDDRRSPGESVATFTLSECRGKTTLTYTLGDRPLPPRTQARKSTAWRRGVAVC